MIKELEPGPFIEELRDQLLLRVGIVGLTLTTGALDDDGGRRALWRFNDGAAVDGRPRTRVERLRVGEMRHAAERVG